jgi:hypothetical protein
MYVKSHTIYWNKKDMVSKLYEQYSNFYCVNYISGSFTTLPQQLHAKHTTNRTSPKSYYTVSLCTRLHKNRESIYTYREFKHTATLLSTFVQSRSKEDFRNRICIEQLPFCEWVLTFSVQMCQVSHSNPAAMHKSLLREWMNHPDPKERKTAVTKTRETNCYKQSKLRK